MSKSKSSATYTNEKKSQQDQILDRLFNYFSKPKGEKPTSDNDIEVSFYKSALSALPKNFHNNNYNGVNIVMLLMAQEESATKVPIYATFKQASALLEQNRQHLPSKSDDFDPDKPLKGIKLNAQVVKYLESYKKDGEVISKSLFEKGTKGLSFKQMKDKGYEIRKGLRGYKVFPIEKIKHLLPQSFINQRDYFAKQEALDTHTMSPEMEDQRFMKQAQLIIDAMGVPVIERNEDRAYYSPNQHSIIVPPRNKFKSDKAFFAVVLHELSHSTAKALGREINNPFGSASYAKEELIAETATMFMCLNEGLETFHSHAKYLESWASHFTNKKKTLLSICKQAKDAQQYIADKVASHKLKLVNQATYSIPNELDTRVDFDEQYHQELSEFINTQSRSYGLMIPLKNQRIVGFSQLDKGLAVYTDEKCINIYGSAAKNLEKKLSELEVKQELSNCTRLGDELGLDLSDKVKKSNRLSL